MTEENNERFVIEHEGEEHLFEEVFRFNNPETDVSYIVLQAVEEQQTSEEDDEDEQVEVFAFRFEEGEDDKIAFYPIESDEEWDMVEEMLQTFAEE